MFILTNILYFHIYMSEEEIPRATPSNPFKYSNLELADKEKQIKAAIRDYPNLPPSMIDMAYDLVKNTPNIDEIIETGAWEKMKPKERALDNGSLSIE